MPVAFASVKEEDCRHDRYAVDRSDDQKTPWETTFVCR